jgi:hypothetical protein
MVWPKPFAITDGLARTVHKMLWTVWAQTVRNFDRENVHFFGRFGLNIYIYIYIKIYI